MSLGSAYCVYVDLAQAYLALGKTQHGMCMLPESLDYLSRALDINEKYFRENYPGVCILVCI